MEVPAADHQSVWVRLPVVNGPRRKTAHDVEVTLESIEPLDDEVRPDLRRDLAGAAGRQLKWADRSDRVLSIHPGAARRFDLVHARIYPSADQNYCRMTFRDPGHGDDGHAHGWRGVLLPGSYRVTFSVEAADIDSRQFSCVIKWAGGLEIDVSVVTRIA
ncbi:hypothetical protein BG418_07535 [Streptomyces sp. CBMA152]|nr:hypothetical protein [Streptomyces sp. CBMA152]